MSTRHAAGQLVAAIKSDMQPIMEKLASIINARYITICGIITTYSGILWLLAISVATEAAKDGIAAAQCDMAWVSNIQCPPDIPPKVEYVDPLPQPVHNTAKDEDNPAPKPIPSHATNSVDAYVNRFAKIAQQEQAKFGIPASISLAQGIIESRYGTSTLAVRNNNHFGIKCHSRGCKRGHCTNHSDDSHKDFFRKYNTAWESWRAHSNVLMSPRYKAARGHGYRKWAQILKSKGYATDHSYTNTLISTIEKYKLYRYDNAKFTAPAQVASASRVKPAAKYSLVVSD